MHVTTVRTDLIAEQQALDAIAVGLTTDQWARPTASPRWSVADQIGHLAYFDRSAALAITAPEEFKRSVEEAMAAAEATTEDVTDLALDEFRQMTPDELLAAWRRDRSALADASADLADDDRVIWYGPSMGSKSFLTARLMEVWAHGQDIVDAVGVTRPATDRLAHIAQLGFITRGWTYVNRGLEVPETPVCVALTSRSGATWTYGPVDAAESISGSAEDFCLVVTQRRHVDDTDLTVVGDAARDWMLKTQAFAGPPTDGPPSRH